MNEKPAGCLLEIAANSHLSALAAQAGGADRIELCENLGEGGTTPSYGTLARTRDRLSIPIFVLIRPRAGDFLYGPEETEVMLHDIAACRQLGCDGVVIGALDAGGDIDLPLCRELVSAASGMGVTFHRAFDAVRDPARALEAVVALGCDRVLTSGGQADAVLGAAAIAGHVRQAAGRIAILAGAGLTPGNVAGLVQATGVNEVHASAKARRATAMAFHNPALAGLEYDRQETDPAIVTAFRRALATL
ncbi:MULTISPECIES: copper homeostasis protein CutC [unclassified Pseudoxanthomonas]|uniref:copper homeostasis protein CutC n=1 Tax=unclassified Pseudoxanthomonas TaxID=2645906 RepID=UPI00161E2380|nr:MULTISPECIES: copper homeostasis protein CutC [unclassified Pseudoxanthomonas]MBB3274394.1 copper homeostasis protein [Pseudoxanthomonas sp. OG2]MBV7474900.1 copper homeostasis protein CutC [Pseudoxanthomonas sp. PXM05]